MSDGVSVDRENRNLVMDFTAVPATPGDGLDDVLGVRPKSELLAARDYLAALASLDCEAVIVPALGETIDFVSSFFAQARRRKGPGHRVSPLHAGSILGGSLGG